MSFLCGEHFPLTRFKESPLRRCVEPAMKAFRRLRTFSGFAMLPVRYERKSPMVGFLSTVRNSLPPSSSWTQCGLMRRRLRAAQSGDMQGLRDFTNRLLFRADPASGTNPFCSCMLVRCSGVLREGLEQPPRGARGLDSVSNEEQGYSSEHSLRALDAI